MEWFVGTSGWSYDNWEGSFYPEGLPGNQRLEYYAKHFDAVEVNNSFYHLVSHEQLKKWQQTVPKTFTFAIKASRYLTHVKKMKDPQEPMARFVEPTKYLRKFGPMIFQLPPRFHKNEERLAEFLTHLPKNHRCAMEFRDPDWHDEAVYALLKKHNVAFCLFEKGELRSPRLATAEDFIYVRLHGRKEDYRGNYSDKELKDWQEWLTDQNRDVYIFFDNTEEKLYALDNARSMKEKVAVK